MLYLFIFYIMCIELISLNNSLWCELNQHLIEYFA